ncbi:MAG TPA: site-2 protease family protein [Anaerolinea sp.]|nr:site-2 protease family protein [Anaerolinea sp.]
MESALDFTTIDTLVARILQVEDKTMGGEKDRFLMRYRGRIYLEDTAAAYDQLAALLQPYHLTPLFRFDGDRHAVLLVPQAAQPKPGNSRLNLILFIATVISVLVTGALVSPAGLPVNGQPSILELLVAALPFTVSFIAILTAHEFGHYLVGRYHGVHVSLPYFIPLPIVSGFGTMGAFINMKEQPKNRRILLDIGLAGPLSGLVVTVVVLVIGLSLSDVSTLPAAASATPGVMMEGNSLLYLLLKFLRFGQLLPHPASYGGVAPALYWLRYFFTGTPFPFGGLDVTIHPVAWAGWGGMLITSLNLIPAGQLDGGHVLYVLLGRKRAARLLPVILALLIGLGFFWNGWWLWAALIFFFGRLYAEPLDEITPLDPARKALAVGAIILFLLVFIPVPLVAF